jgi:hypothetical protein
MVGFVAGPLDDNLLVHAGFLPYFRGDLDGDAREADLLARPAFPGRRT